MKKFCVVSVMCALLFTQTALAFNYNGALSGQTADYSNTLINTDGFATLSQTQVKIRALDISPNYSTSKLMYLSAQDGVYTNSSYDANFQKNTVLSQKFPTGLKKVQFEGDYNDTGMMLAYDESKIFISYTYGGSWDQITFDKDEEIVEADFGPNFASNKQLYVVTKNGLYRKTISSENIEKLLTADTAGELKNFRYVRTQDNDRAFFIVKGNKLLKTENFASTWIETPFTSNIKDFEIKQTTLTEGNLLVLTDDNKIYKSGWAINFIQLDLPAEVTTVYAVDYIILTNNGFYITYNDGSSWSKLNYSSLTPTAVSDYDFVVDGSQKLFYVTENNTLKRDVNLVETFNNYMTGLTLGSNYSAEGFVSSKNILQLAGQTFGSAYSVESATLYAEGDLNGGTMKFFMSNDGGITWVPAVAGELLTFITSGQDLRWKAELTTADTSKTPVLKSVMLDYGVEETTLCAGFTDIAFNDPDCSAFEYVKTNGIFTGYPDGTFLPDAVINRAETVKVVTEGFNTPMLSADGTNLGFSDVEITGWYMGYLKTAKDAGIIEGYPDGTFKPAQTVNYVEMMKIFLETAEVVVPEAAAGAQWYTEYVNYADENGLILYTDVSSGMKRRDVAKLFYQWNQMP